MNSAKYIEIIPTDHKRCNKNIVHVNMIQTYLYFKTKAKQQAKKIKCIKSTTFNFEVKYIRN